MLCVSACSLSNMQILCMELKKFLIQNELYLLEWDDDLRCRIIVQLPES